MADLLAALDHVLATAECQALSLESAADRDRLRELVAADLAAPAPSAGSSLGEGWAMASNSRVAHYFRSGRSLCGKWGMFSPVVDREPPHGTPCCVACSRACPDDKDKP